MAKPSAAECEEEGGMSAFGFLSFVLAVVNAAINTANNVNRNPANWTLLIPLSHLDLFKSRMGNYQLLISL